MNTLPINSKAPWLAPLAGYSDLPFRMLCRNKGCAVACTEMVSIKGLKYGGRNTFELLDTHEKDTPLVVQVFGGEPEDFTEAMPSLVERGFEWFDLNCGCSVKKVLKTGGGSGLMLDPDRLVAIAKNMITVAGEGRVGIKIRLGFNYGEDNYIDVSKRLQDIGAGWITLHPRYGKQLFTGDADWSKLALLKKAIDIPVIGSGDLFTAQDGVDCINQTGIDNIMFARGALYDPAIFAKYLELLESGNSSPVSPDDLGSLMREHIEMTKQFYGTTRSFRKVRSILPRYAKGLDGIRSIRARLTQCENWDELFAAADEVCNLIIDSPESSG
jgi:tRNA-dihydrouridine synthase B